MARQGSVPFYHRLGSFQDRQLSLDVAKLGEASLGIVGRQRITGFCKVFM